MASLKKIDAGCYRVMVGGRPTSNFYALMENIMRAFGLFFSLIFSCAVLLMLLETRWIEAGFYLMAVLIMAYVAKKAD